AGIMRNRMSFNMTDGEWSRVFEVHTRGMLNLLAATLPEMRTAGYGRFTGFTSSAGVFGATGSINYSTAKGVVEALTRVLARPLADDGILLNCVAPSARTRLGEQPYVTASGDTGVVAAAMQALRDRNGVPVPEDDRGADKVGRVVAALSSSRNQLTGQCLFVVGNQVSVVPPRQLGHAVYGTQSVDVGYWERVLL